MYSHIAQASPYTPTSPEEVLETLPYSFREISKKRHSDGVPPLDSQSVFQQVRENLQLARKEGDPRYLGYAESEIEKYLHNSSQSVPPEAYTLRATIKQSNHDFNGALEDLVHALTINPRDVQAILTKSTILGVQGRYDLAKKECAHLFRMVDDLIFTTCVASAAGLSGDARKSLSLLQQALSLHAPMDPDILSWSYGILADIAERLEDFQSSEKAYRKALSLSPDDRYLKTAFSDFLLFLDRGEEVPAVVGSALDSDALLLRRAFAYKKMGRSEFDQDLRILNERFHEGAIRGDTIHLRERAYYSLFLREDFSSALDAAKENWNSQKETIDLRLLLLSALAAKDDKTLKEIDSWFASTKMENIPLAKIRKPS